MLTLSRCSSPSPSTKVSSSNPDRRNRWASLAKPVLGVSLAMGVLTAGQAQAFVVNVNGQDWDVTTFTGSYNDNVSKFNTLENGGMMPWWENYLASSFADAVGDSLGFLTDYPGQTYPLWGGVLSPSGYVLIPVQGAIGPLFGYYHGGCDPGICGSAYVAQTGHPWNGYGAVFGKHDVWTWAQATLVAGGSTSGSAENVPGPLPIFGAAAAFGFSRKLRKRIKGSTNPVPNSYSL